MGSGVSRRQGGGPPAGLGGWQSQGHEERRYPLAGERDDLSLRAAFAAAEKFHANFYSGFMEEYEFGPDGEIVRDFVHRMLNGYMER